MRNFKIEDFTGSGQYLVCAHDEKYIKSDGFLSTILFKLGYRIPFDGTAMKYCLIAMSDGLMMFESSKAGIVDYLNNIENQEYRFATGEELVRVVKYQAAFSNRAVE